MNNTKTNEVLSQSLFANLLHFLRLYHKSMSENTLLEGFPVQNNQKIPNMLSLYKGEPLFISIAKKAGFKAKFVEKDMDSISEFILPAILVCQDGTSCILEKIDKERQTATLSLPEFETDKETIALEKLKRNYAGKMFLMKKIFNKENFEDYTLQKTGEHWFWGTIKNNFSIYKDVVVSSFLINVFVLISPFFVMNVYDRVVPNFAVETLWALSIGIVIIYIFDIILKFIRGYYIDIVSKKIDIIVSSKIFDKILNLKLSHRPKSIGAFANNIKDFETVKNFFSSSTISVLVDIPFVILFLVAIFYISGIIVLVPIVFICFIIVYALFIRKPLYKSIESSNSAVAYKNGILIESLNALETLKSLGSTGNLRWKWEESTADISTKSILIKLLSASISNVNSFLAQVSTVAVVIFGVYAVNERELTLGGLIAAVILSSRAIVPMGQFATLLSNYQQAKASYLMLENIMNLPEERENNRAGIHKEIIQGSIEFKHVSFFYNENKKILDDINFQVSAGEKVAIIGKMGSGKTTLLKLLMQLYDTTEGEIIIDGVEIKQIEPADIRKNFAYVSQETMLFNGTLKENILYKYPYQNDNELLKASKVSQLLNFVNMHPLGFDLQIGEKGETLSGGQRKSVSIARALIGEYSTLLLDEPTDSMDTYTEQCLIRDLKNEIKEKTLLLVTHKNSMLELVDRIIVVDNGKIVIDGEKMKVLKFLSGNRS